MSWTTPRTWVDGEVLTASLLNTHIRDNLLATGFTSAGVITGSLSVSGGISTTTVLADSAGGEITLGYAGTGGLAIAQGNVATHINGVVLWVSGTTLYARKPNGTDVTLG